jgi:hypothetical protein
MQADDTVVAVFTNHEAADSAVRKLTQAGFPMTALSVIGKGYHTEEKAVGFYNIGERVMFWGSRGAFWGGLWGLFLGGLFLTVPVVGHVIVLGYLAATTISVVEGAVVVGGLSAIGAALASIGVPQDSVVRYETALKADGFLVTAHGSSQDVARAKAILAAERPASVDVHASADAGLALAGA